MKRIALTLIGIIAALSMGCDDGTSDSLTNGGGGGSRDPNSTAGGENSTYDHNNDPGAASGDSTYQPPEAQGAATVKYQGSPEVASRMHGCGKIAYSTLGRLLDSRGIAGQGKQIYNGAGATLGAPNYNGRVPEASFASTSAMAKLFDIFAMGADSVVAQNYNPPACPNVKVVDAGKFTKDGLSCLLGKPARDEHVALANQAITQNQTDGAKIAIAAALAAAHTCE